MENHGTAELLSFCHISTQNNGIHKIKLVSRRDLEYIGRGLSLNNNVIRIKLEEESLLRAKGMAVYAWHLINIC